MDPGWCSIMDIPLFQSTTPWEKQLGAIFFKTPKQVIIPSLPISPCSAAHLLLSNSLPCPPPHPLLPLSPVEAGRGAELLHPTPARLHAELGSVRDSSSSGQVFISSLPDLPGVSCQLRSKHRGKEPVCCHCCLSPSLAPCAA